MNLFYFKKSRFQPFLNERNNFLTLFIRFKTIFFRFKYSSGKKLSNNLSNFIIFGRKQFFHEIKENISVI